MIAHKKKKERKKSGRAADDDGLKVYIDIKTTMRIAKLLWIGLRKKNNNKKNTTGWRAFS